MKPGEWQQDERISLWCGYLNSVNVSSFATENDNCSERYESTPLFRLSQRAGFRPKWPRCCCCLSCCHRFFNPLGILRRSTFFSLLSCPVSPPPSHRLSGWCYNFSPSIFIFFPLAGETDIRLSVCLSIAQHSPRPLVKSGSWKMNNIRRRKIERFLSQLFPTRVPSSPGHTAIAIFAFVLRSDEKCSIYWNCPLLSGMGPLDSGRCKRIRAWRRNPECLWVSFFFLWWHAH